MSEIINFIKEFSFFVILIAKPTKITDVSTTLAEHIWGFQLEYDKSNYME